MLLPAVLAPWVLPTRYRGYEPQPVTRQSVVTWLQQFDRRDRQLMMGLVHHVRYLSKTDIRRALVQLNSTLLARLRRAGVPPDHVVYVQIDEAGGSSPVMLNTLRDSARLLQQNCHLLDGRDASGLHDATDEIGQGAIVYVDDFAGSGDQFVAAHGFAAQYIVGTFSEFYLVPCMCEEALIEIGKTGVEPVTKFIHSKAERPLHDNSTLLDPASKERLIQIAHDIDDAEGLGYGGLATMVVLSHGAPDTTPLLLRGSLGQEPYQGIFPRVSDLPALP